MNPSLSRFFGAYANVYIAGTKRPTEFICFSQREYGVEGNPAPIRYQYHLGPFEPMARR